MASSSSTHRPISSSSTSRMPRYLSRRTILPILVSIPIMLGLLFVVGVLVGPGVAGNIALGKGVDGLKQAVVDVVGGGGGGSAAVGQSAEGDGQQVDVGSRRVKVDLSVMSRCPDAFVCEATMDKVLSHPNIRDQIDLRMNYIGTPDSGATYGVECKHGDLECAGNIHQLCVQEHVRTSIGNETLPPRRKASGVEGERSTLPAVWNFIQAQNYYEPRKIGELEYAKRCAVAAGVDWDGSGVARCVEMAGSGKGGGKQQTAEEAEEGMYDTDEEDLFDEEEEEAYEDDFEGTSSLVKAKGGWLDWISSSILGLFGASSKSSRVSNLLSTSMRRRPEGERLLISSAQRVHSTLHAPKSCTILIEGKIRCIHDGSWYQCDDGHEPADIARSIHDAWKSLNG